MVDSIALVLSLFRFADVVGLVYRDGGTMPLMIGAAMRMQFVMFVNAGRNAVAPSILSAAKCRDCSMMTQRMVAKLRSDMLSQAVSL